MNSLLVLALLAAPLAVQASGAYYDYKELADLEENIHRAANEKRFLRQRVQDFKAEQTAFLDFLSNDFLGPATVTFLNITEVQDARILAIKNKVNMLLNRILNVKKRVKGQGQFINRVIKSANELWPLINAQYTESKEQLGLLSRIDQGLRDSQEKLDNVLLSSTVQGVGSSDVEFQTAIDDFVERVNTRKCFTDYVEVTLDPATAEGSADLMIQMTDLIPTVLCGVQGLTTTIDDYSSHGYGGYGGGYGYGYGKKDERENSALTVDCQPFRDRVTVNVFDLSRGYDNQVASSFVQVRYCTLPPLI